MSTAEPTADFVAQGVDADNPWLGLASFTEATRGYFFGREGEVTELTRRVQRQLLTVLFGKSGLGKTSILRAGLVPRLRSQGYFPVYLRIDYGQDSPEPAEQIKQAIHRAAQELASAQRGPNEAGEPWSGPEIASAGESIWEFLHHRDAVLKDASGQTLTPLLIFDQFEELFTLAQSDELGRTRAARFIEELADLVENRPPRALEEKLDSDETLAERFDFARSDYRVVIALREDYLAPLEALKRQMPSLSQNRLRLAPMTGSQALEAVLRPGKHLVSEEVAEAIVRFVAGGSELANAEVEPSLLSLICRELNEQRIAQGKAEISQDLLAGSHDTILSNFYERSLADQPASVRRILEEDLLTESGYRENLAEESLLHRFRAAGAAPDALAKLVNRRLLRIEERLDVRRVELTHDVLTGVVKASRDQRHARETQEAAERALTEQREREQAARRALRRARAVAAGSTLLALLAIAATVVAVFSLQRARRADQVAQQTRVISEQARREAQGLLGFLSDDFVRELETFGRYQTIAELSQQEIDYFRHLPAQLEDAQTLRSEALALGDHAEALRHLGHLNAARGDAAAAVALLERLRRGGDRSDATAVGLARAYLVQGHALTRQLSPAGITDLTRAAALLRPIAARPGASIEARRAYLDALTWIGREDSVFGNAEDAIPMEREAQHLAVQLGAPRSGDVTVNAAYAIAISWRAWGLGILGRDQEARRVDAAGLDVANQVLAQRPQYGQVLFAKMQILGNLANAANRALDPVESLRWDLQAQQTARTMISVEPRNTNYVFEYAASHLGAGRTLWQAGRLSQAIPYYRKAMGEFGKISAGGEFFIGYLSGVKGTLAAAQAKLGDAAGVSATLASAEAYTDKLHLTGSLMELVEVTRAYPQALLAYERDDFGAARRIASNTLTRLRTARFTGFLRSPGIPNQPFCRLSELEGSAEYRLGHFAAAVQAERSALQTCRPEFDMNVRRLAARIATRLSMALAGEGQRAEAARTIAPVVTLYRGLDRKNHGDQWLPLEFAQALYAQSLTDPQHGAALLKEASGLVDHLIPAIARLHDARTWRVRIRQTLKHAARSAGNP